MNNEIVSRMQAVIPHGMENTAQFITFKMVPSLKQPGKFDKVPCDENGIKVDAFDRSNWLTAYDAVARSMRTTHGVGFVFTELDPFWFIDLDNAYDPATRQWSELARAVCSHFPGCALEISISGKGAHLFGSGEVDDHRKRRPGIEFYTESRFAALTGTGKAGNAAIDFTAAMPAFITAFGLQAPPAAEEVTIRVSGLAHDANPDPDDYSLIRRMCEMDGDVEMQFGNKCHPRHLWERNVTELARWFAPIGQGEVFDNSAADLSLMGRLYYYTGDLARAERLFHQSGIRRPDKYAARPELMTYIMKRIGGAKKFFDLNFRSNPTPGVTAAGVPYQVVAQAGAAAIAMALRNFGISATLNQIMAMDLPEPEYLAEGLLAPGMQLLIGKPKKGKSWMVLDLCLNVAVGGNFLGRQCVQANVLYFALEDNKRRIQKRMRMMMPASFTVGSDQLKVLTMEDKVENMDRGFIQNLRHTLEQDPHLRLVAIDTLSMVRPSKKGNEGVYDYDRRSIDAFTQLCGDFPQVTIVIVHHSRKAESDDPHDMASGSLGLTGAADGMFFIGWDGKNQVTMLHAKGRDIEPFDLAMKFTLPRWQILGDPDEVGMGESQRKIIDVLTEAKAPMTMTEIYVAADMPKTNVQTLLRTMVKQGKIIKSDKIYMLTGG